MSSEVSVLVVDDTVANLTATKAVLEGLPARIVTASSGKEALRKLLEQDFAAILLDVQMPDMDGFETAELIRQRDKSRHVPIMFVTAIDKADIHVARGYSLGAVDYIFKPIIPQIVRAKVAVFVELHQMRLREVATADALRRKTEELERSNADLSQFAHVAAHDMQEPLRTVHRSLKLLSRRTRDKADASSSEFIDLALKGSEDLLHLIQELLDYSRLGAARGALQPVDCNALLARAVASLSQLIDDSGATITHDVLPTALGDENQLLRVFQNLLRNAIIFRGSAPPAIHVTAARQADAWRIAFRDNGIGIDPEHRERIFNLFERLHGRRDYPGTGVGLAICKRIIEAHGGHIRVEANRGGGSVFSFTLRQPESRMGGDPPDRVR